MSEIYKTLIYFENALHSLLKISFQNYVCFFGIHLTFIQGSYKAGNLSSLPAPAYDLYLYQMYFFAEIRRYVALTISRGFALPLQRIRADLQQLKPGC